MLAPIGLTSAMNAASSGLARTHQQAADAAVEVERSVDTVSISGDSPPNMARGLVDLRVARYQQTANLAVLRTADEMSRQVLEIAK